MIQLYYQVEICEQFVQLENFRVSFFMFYSKSGSLIDHQNCFHNNRSMMRTDFF